MSSAVNLRATLGWRLSSHARHQAAARGVSAQAILEAIAAPDVRYPSRQHIVLVRGLLAVVVDETTTTVITVLLHSDHRWSDAEARALLGAA